MHPEAVGWDWIGMNLFDGSALTAFVLRRRDGSALWAGGSFRRNGGTVQAFEADQVRWKPGRSWRSPGSGATYPVHWSMACPAGQFQVRALADAQELDSRASTGTIYWEGLSELLDGQGQRIGLGYLEMTGYAAAIKV
jgi:predicted secreted hydrolase